MVAVLHQFTFTHRYHLYTRPRVSNHRPWKIHRWRLPILTERQFFHFEWYSELTDEPGCAWRGCSSACRRPHRPLASVLQIENKPHASHDFCFFANLMKAGFQRFSQCKNPLSGVFVFCLISGAGGNRTRVQTWRPYAFYMLIHALFS